MQQLVICPQRALGKEWAAQGMSSLQVSPLVFHTCAYIGCFGKCVEQGPKSPQLVRASHFHPLGPDVQFKCLNTTSQVVKPVLNQNSWLEHDLWWYSWSIFLVLTKPCEIVASYLCSFFLKWNAQWWCQWLIITFCDWEYRFHCKINADVNCLIFM